MKTSIHHNEFGDEVIVEEFQRREFADLAATCIDDAKYCDECDAPYEDTIYIEYRDGSTFSYYDSFGFEGKFSRTNIAFGVISNSCTQQVVGDYIVNERGIVEPA